MNVEDFMGETDLSAYMPYINKDIFKKPEVINNFLTTIGGHEAKNIYFVAASGSRVLASQMIEEHVKSTGRNTFNHLHEQVLKVSLSVHKMEKLAILICYITVVLV